MNKEQILEALKECEDSLKLAHKRLNELGTENKVLKELVHHLASRPPPVQYMPPTPYVQPPQNRWWTLPTISTIQGDM